MEWTAKDISIFLKNRAYVDTVIIPLMSIDFEKDMLACAREGEYIHFVCRQLEKQLAGRVLQCPPYTYLKETNKETLIDNLCDWDTMLIQNGFTQRYYITSDTLWINAQRIEKNIKWMPALPVELLEQEQLFQMIDDTVQNLVSEISSKWVSS